MKDTIVLEGEHVRLEPLAERHLPELVRSAHDPALWELTFQSSPFSSLETARAWLRDARDPNTRAFAIIERAGGAVAGSTRMLEIDEPFRKFDIGWTFLTRRFWRTSVNTESKLLLLAYGFEQWGAQRIEFRAEAINTRSHAALLRIGAVHEGTMRAFRIRPDGQVRDVNLYSIVAPEWPAVKERLLSLLGRTPGSLAAE